MNQSQRSFLIKKIEKTISERKEAIKNKKPKEPNLSSYAIFAIMGGTVIYKSPEDLKEVMIKKAKQGETNFINSTWRDEGKGEITLPLSALIELPEDYVEAKRIYDEEVDRINDEFRIFSAEAESLIMRIQLASDKVLQSVISEVDDIGNLSLFDDKIKLLSK